MSSMTQAESIRSVEQALVGIRAVADHVGRRQVDALLDRLGSGELRVLLAGEAKRGKSTLANALIGRDLLPSGVTPVTAVPTTIRSGPSEELEIAFVDGRRERHPLAKLPDFVSQSRNPSNRLGVEEVGVDLEAGLPTADLVLIDSPGMGSVFTDNTDQARRSLEAMDMAILVLTSDAPMSAAERSLLQRLSEMSAVVAVVLNKTDRLSYADLGEARDFVSAVVEEVLGRPTTVYPCSARTALHARETDDEEEWCRSGVAALSAAIVRQATDGRQATVRLSVSAAAYRMALRQLDQRQIELAAATATMQERSEIVTGLQDVIARLNRAQTEAIDLGEQGMKRLVRRLEQLGSGEVGMLSRQGQQAAAAALAASAARSPVDLEDQGRAAIAGVVQTGIEELRCRFADAIRQETEQQQERTQQLLERAYLAVAEAVRELLRIDLTATAPPPQAVRLPTLRYTFTEDVGWNHAIRSGLRHVGSHSRRRIRRYLDEEADRLADQHVGRLLGDLRRALTETGRRRDALTRQAFDDLGDELRRADVSARQLAQLSQTDLVPALDDLRGRVQLLRDLAEQLRQLSEDIADR